MKQEDKYCKELTWQKNTMIVDIVKPTNNEEALLTKARELGYTALIGLYDQVPKTAFPGITPLQLIPATTFLRQNKPNCAVQSSTSDRAVLERGVKLMFGFEEQERYDGLHHHNSGLNHVLCTLAVERGTHFALNLHSLIASPSLRGQIMGRMMQNIKLCRKLDVKLIVGSFATNPIELRAPGDINALLTLLGMQQEEIKIAMLGP